MILLSSFLFSVHGMAGQFQDVQQAEKTTQRGNEILIASNGFYHAQEEVLASLSPGERKWYHRFQEGIPLFDGWKKITQAVVEKFPEHEREKRLAAMQALGVKIGYEWSRDNRVRRVNTDMLRAWGKDLRKAGAESHVQLANVLYKIDSEMNTLLHLE
ncbi:MAG: hypothetical protein KKF37_08970 [Proteobacteria bacterium]|nr:hypothetical protein [Pseudomonadota bacterium]